MSWLSLKKNFKLLLTAYDDGDDDNQNNNKCEEEKEIFNVLYHHGSLTTYIWTKVGLVLASMNWNRYKFNNLFFIQNQLHIPYINASFIIFSNLFLETWYFWKHLWYDIKANMQISMNKKIDSCLKQTKGFKCPLPILKLLVTWSRIIIIVVWILACCPSQAKLSLKGI